MGKGGKKKKKSMANKDPFKGCDNLPASQVLRTGILTPPLSTFVTWTSCLSSLIPSRSCFIGMF